MNKKGADLTLNTIIIGILVVLVLVVLVAFFLGGTAGLTKTIKSIFFGTTAGTDQTIAIETCRQRCDQLDTLVSDKDAAARKTIIPASAFCNAPFKIDKDNDGIADYVKVGENNVDVKYYCNKVASTDGAVNTLGVSCKYDCTNPQ